MLRMLILRYDLHSALRLATVFQRKAKLNQSETLRIQWVIFMCGTASLSKEGLCPTRHVTLSPLNKISIKYAPLQALTTHKLP